MQVGILHAAGNTQAGQAIASICFVKLARALFVWWFFFVCLFFCLFSGLGFFLGGGTITYSCTRVAKRRVHG